MFMIVSWIKEFKRPTSGKGEELNKGGSRGVDKKTEAEDADEAILRATQGTLLILANLKEQAASAGGSSRWHCFHAPQHPFTAGSLIPNSRLLLPKNTMRPSRQTQNSKFRLQKPGKYGGVAASGGANPAQQRMWFMLLRRVGKRGSARYADHTGTPAGGFL